IARYSERKTMKTTFRARVLRLLAHVNLIRSARTAAVARAEGAAEVLGYADGRPVRSCKSTAVAQVQRRRCSASNEPAYAVPCGRDIARSSRHRGPDLRLVQICRGENRVRAAGACWRTAAVAMTLGCAAATQARAESFFEMEAGLGVNHYSSMNGVWNQIGAP